MAEAFRRVILKPSGLDESTAAQLAEGLAASIDTQRSYASKSPHVLQIIGELQQDDRAFYIEHEPATVAWSTRELFDRSAPGADEEQLLRVTAALFDALNAAHGSQPPLPRAHGGLCPGTILTTTDGIEKVTDFGFAAVICAALGPESYVNLAVGAPFGDSEIIEGTGVWEVLSPEEFDREDRICAFVDPDKYGTAILGAFEPGSDIIAAGFLLHLLAERQHPYLHADPDAHRMVEMSEFMAMARYNNARRQDLRESANAGIKLWCELVAKMLARLPQERPTAAEVSKALGEFVKPVDASEILRRRLEGLIQRVRETPREQVDWEREKQNVQSIAGSDGVSPEVEAQAQRFIQEAHARVQLGRALTDLAGDEWYAAQRQLGEVLALPGLPPDVKETARSAAASLQGYLSQQTELDDIETACNAAHDAGPAAARHSLEELTARLERLGPREDMPASLQARRNSLVEKTQTFLAEATAELERIEREQREAAERLERERAGDFEKARAWGEDLKEAFAAKEWELLGELLRGRPELTHWPEEVERLAGDLQRKLEEHVAEIERQAAIEEDARRAEAWLQQVRTAIDGEDWKAAEQRLADRPSLAHWPDGAKDEEEQYRDTVRAFRKKEADHRQADVWLAALRKSVESKAWNKAAEVLADKPTLEYWPAAILEQEPALRADVEKNLEAIKLQQLRLERERQQARDWLNSAKEAAGQERWDEALQALETPPAISKLPADLEKEAKALRQSCTRNREEARERLRQQRTDQVIQATSRFVSGLLTERFQRFLDDGLVETRVADLAFETEETFSNGQARLTVGLREDGGGSGGAEFESPFEFQVTDGAVLVCDDDGALAKRIADHIQNRLIALQKARLAELFASLGKGVFPKLKLDVKLNGLTERQNVTVALCGEKSDESTLRSEIRWDPATLRWSHVDPASFAGRALQIATDAAKRVVGPKVFGSSKPLKQYETFVLLEVVPPDLQDPSHFPAPLPLKARLSLRPGDRAEPVPLQTVGVTCARIGEVSLDAALTPAESALNHAILQAQNSSRASIESDLARRSKAASAKVKIASSPKPIKDARKDVRIELKPRRGELLSLTPKWHPDSFSFHLEDNWEERLNAFLSEAAAGSKGRGMAVPAVVAVCVVAIVGTTGWLMRSGAKTPSNTDTPVTIADRPADGLPTDRGDVDRPADPDRPTDPVTADTTPDGRDTPPTDTAANDNERVADTSPEDTENVNAGPDEEVTPSRLPSIEPAKASVRTLLASSDFISDEAAQDLVAEDASSTADLPRFRVTTPGLVNPVSVVELSEKDATGDWSVSGEAIRALGTTLDALNALLGTTDPIPLTALLADQQAAQLDAYIDRSRLELQVDGRREWRLEDDRWVADGLNATVALAGPPGILTADLQEGRLSLEAHNGRIRVRDSDGSVAAEVVRVALDEVLRIQQASAQQRIDDLAAALAPGDGYGSAPQVRLSSPIERPLQQVRFTVDAWENTLPRDYTATWGAETLSLEFDGDWREGTARQGMAHDVVWLINHDGLPESHWLRTAVQGDVVERASPGEAAWTLAAPAPWAKPGETGNLGPDEILPLQLDATLLKGDASPEEVLDRGLVQPSYWPLVQAYARLLDPAEEAYRVTLLADLPGGDVFDADSLVQPEIIPQSDGVRVNATEGGPQSISFNVQVGLSVNPDHPAGNQISLEALERELGGLLPPTSAVLTITVNGGTAAPNWSGQEQLVGNLSAAGAKITALEEELASLADRQQLEQRLESRLNNVNDGTASPVTPADAFAFLQEIWAVKNAVGPAAADLSALTGNLQGLLARSGQFKQRRERVKPTIFAEYFIGPHSAYALTWSAKPDGSIDGGPALIRLCPTRTLASAQGSGVNTSLGDTLFSPVWNAAPNAIDARSLVLGYDEAIGIVLAPDRLMGLFDLPGLRFTGRDTFLRAIQRGPAAVANSWQSLEDLNTRYQDLACGYRLCPALSKPTEPWSRVPDTLTEAVRWAAQVLAGSTSGGQ